MKKILKDVCKQWGFMPTQLVLVGWTFEIEGTERAISLMYAIRKNQSK